MTDKAENPSTDELVEVCREQGHMRAHVIRSKLEAAGIPATLSYDAASLVFGITVDGLGEVRVLVRPEDAEEARRLVEEHPPGPPEPWPEEPPVDGEEPPPQEHTRIEDHSGS